MSSDSVETPAPTSRRRWRRTPTVLGAVGLLSCSLLAGVACGDDGGGNGGGRSDQADTGPADDGDPEATDAETVQPYIEELLARYDAVVNQVVADPDIAGDPDHPLVQEYLALYEPGSDTARQLVDVWADRAAEGLSTRAVEPDQPPSVTRLDGDVEVRSEREVAFPACIELRLEVVDGEGRVTQRTSYREQQGDGVAVWVDGEWLLRDLVVRNDTASCLTGGSETTQTTEETEETEGS